MLRIAIIILEIILIGILNFMGGFIVAFFEDKYKLGIQSAILIFTFIGMLDVFIIQSW